MVSSSKLKEVSGDNCCSVQPKGKVACPECSKLAKGVLEKTFDALVKEEAKSKLSCMSDFYYCKTPSCKVIYFRDDTILTQQDMKVIVGLKDGASPATVCYCFGWSKEKIVAEIEATGKTMALEDIKAKMQDPGCACEVLNPSGGCCLGDVGKAIKEIESIGKLS
ncbi:MULTISPECIES: hypothetical protein [Sulfurimonas]|uniref:putative iron-sulfur cluster-binding metallochaperone n=1 Tax=Sulfurimonas TaxID=202746 RepID=UPI001265632A|nr:hypothetical protein [Sulfurimonas indica]